VSADRPVVRAHEPGRPSAAGPSARALSLTYCVGVALLAFGAVYQPEALGILAASPGLLLMTGCVLTLPWLRLRRSATSRALHLGRLLMISLLGSALSVVMFGWSTLYATKFLTLVLLVLVWMSPLLLLDVLRVSHVRRSVWVALAVCTLAYVVSDLAPHTMPDAVRAVIFGGGFDQYADGRPRGFTDESSSFATLVARLLLIAYVIWEARRPYSGLRLIGFLAGVALVLVALGSKGAVGAIALALIAVCAGRRQIGYLLLLLPLAAWTASTQLEALLIDIAEFTSTSTRVGMAMAGLLAVLVNPIGYGHYGFYGAVHTFGNVSMEWLSGVSPFIWTEMQEIVNELINVSTKSTTLDFAICFGWAFLWLLWTLSRRIDLHDPRARAVFTYLIVSSLSTSANASVLFFLGMAMLLRLFPRREWVAPRRRGHAAAGMSCPVPRVARPADEPIPCPSHRQGST
jgi:hypothetical protein